MNEKGITFTETVNGFVNPGSTEFEEGAEEGRAHGMEFSMNLTVLVENFDDLSPEREICGTLSGSIDYAPFGRSIPVLNGIFRLFISPEDPLMKYALYEFNFNYDDEEYFFSARKEIKDDPGCDLWEDITTVFLKIYEGRDKFGEVAAAGILHISFGEIIAMIKSLKSVNSDGVLDSAATHMKFGALFLGELWDTYAGFALKR